MADRDLLVPPVDPTPEDRSVVLADIYRPRRKSEFLTGMLRTLASGSMSIFRFGEDSPPHRLLLAVAMELELMSRSFGDGVTLAIRQAVYRAFRDDLLFPARGGATYARGYVILALNSPTNLEMTIEAGESFSTSDGRTLRSLARVVWPVGDATCAVPVASDTPGAIGFLPPGAVTQHLTPRANYLVTNPAAITGGQDEESDASMYRRFQQYVASFRTGSRGAVLSAATNARVDGERTRDAALILPWRLPTINREMGYAFVVIDSGAGTCSQGLLTRAQLAVEAVTATAEEIRCLSCSPFVLSPAVDVECRPNADVTATRLAVETAWARLLDDTLVEDGTGRGTVDVGRVRDALDAVPGVLSVTLPGLTADVQVPLGARALAGTPVVTAYATRRTAAELVGYGRV